MAVYLVLMRETHRLVGHRRTQLQIADAEAAWRERSPVHGRDTPNRVQTGRPRAKPKYVPTAGGMRCVFTSVPVSPHYTITFINVQEMQLKVNNWQ